MATGFSRSVGLALALGFAQQASAARQVGGNGRNTIQEHKPQETLQAPRQQLMATQELYRHGGDDMEVKDSEVRDRGMFAVIGGAWDAITPDLRTSCWVTLENKNGKTDVFDRWISVQPKVSTSKKAHSWISLDNWTAWFNSTAGLSAETYAPTFKFDPFVLRNQEAYSERLLLKVMETYGNDATDMCNTEVKVACQGGYLQLLTKRDCSFKQVRGEDAQVTTKPFSSLHHSYSFCAHEEKSTGYFGRGLKYTTDVIVVDDVGGDHLILRGNCVEVSLINPTSGIELTPLNHDLMGSGPDLLAEADIGRLDKIALKLSHTANAIAVGLVHQVEGVVEGVDDAITVAERLGTDVDEGAEDAKNKTVKWVKRLMLDTMVETCLCCDDKVIDTQDRMADRCMVAYTLGGEDKEETIKYSLKTAAGTLYNLAQTAGGWLVPFLGGNIVQESHKSACQFVCDLRKPGEFEKYGYAQVRRVPGLAFQTWFIPNPSAFASSAAAGTAEAAAEGAANGAATNVGNNIVAGAVDAAT
eukprot:TRINITY_DN38556_c0_g2_i1.p1 TRINITY_DN38556_c0_g2~~TRINITY_DN38556_c0_g2_i1.p1  ORF type:complete len:570 (-),score=113.32 TRINITY_DN38556_c0_g2_i1:48-1631(-)